MEKGSTKIRRIKDTQISPSTKKSIKLKVYK